MPSGGSRTADLVAGGQPARGLELVAVDPGAVAAAEIFDFDRIAGAAHDRGVHALVGTSPPRALVIGGSSSDGVGIGLVEMLDEDGIDRLEIANMARIDLTATALTDGRVMVIGGKPPPTALLSATSTRSPRPARRSRRASSPRR